MTKILFIHNTAMWYRIPFFTLLSQIYKIKFVFTHMKVSKEIYNVEKPDSINGLQNINYIILKNHFGIAFGVIKESRSDYDVMVGGSWDTLSELLETILYFSIAKLRKKSFIIWREDWGWNVKSFKKKLITPLIKLIINNSNAILVPGSKHKEYFVSLGASPEKIFIMPNVNSIENIPDRIDKLKQINAQNKRIILYVGRLVKRKGVEYLINAFSKINDENVVLIIIGNGNYKSELEILSKNLQVEDRVYFLGNIPNEELSSYYSASDICVIPSITYEMGDPWVFVLNEAMSFGKPVIATDAVGAAFDMIENGKNGFIVPERDIDSLYKAINEILSNSSLKEKMGIRSKEIIDKCFKYENMINGFKMAINYVMD